MGVNILFKEQQIQWNGDKILLKTIGAVHNKDMYAMLCSMYTNSLPSSSRSIGTSKYDVGL